MESREPREVQKRKARETQSPVQELSFAPTKMGFAATRTSEHEIDRTEGTSGPLDFVSNPVPGPLSPGGQAARTNKNLRVSAFTKPRQLLHASRASPGHRYTDVRAWRSTFRLQLSEQRARQTSLLVAKEDSSLSSCTGVGDTHISDGERGLADVGERSRLTIRDVAGRSRQPTHPTSTDFGALRPGAGAGHPELHKQRHATALREAIFHRDGGRVRTGLTRQLDHVRALPQRRGESSQVALKVKFDGHLKITIGVDGLPTAIFALQGAVRSASRARRACRTGGVSRPGYPARRQPAPRRRPCSRR